MLKDKSYEEWLKFSKTLTSINSRLSKAKVRVTICENQIVNLKF